MKLDDFKQHDEVKIVEIIKEKMVHVHLNDGYWMTKYKKGDDIKEYGACQCFYSPIYEDYPDYTFITSEQNDSYEALKQEALNKEMESDMEEEDLPDEEIFEEEEEVPEEEEEETPEDSDEETPEEEEE